jgi:transcriptional regulator with XRE-family HTH domain
MTPAQSRAGRALLGWSQTDLARAANVSRSTVADFELKRRPVLSASVERMQLALEDAGIKFTKGKRPGVWMR